MTVRLFFQAILKYLLGAGVTGLLIFGSAGTIHYSGGWLLMGILFVPMFLAGVTLMVKNPALLEKRLHAREAESDQQLVIRLSGLMFVAGFVLAGLDFRFGWLPLPGWVSLTASVVFLASYGLYGEVVRENTYLSRTIEVQEGQKVIDTGLYGVVRHPMYSATLLLFLSIPLVLGSLIAFFVFLSYPWIISLRIKNEEKVLEEGLEGYRAYETRVKYRLIPYIW